MKKKLIYGMALSCSILLLAGCGDADNTKKEEKEEKKENTKTQLISCTMSESEDGMSISSTIEFTFDKSKKEYTDGKMIMGYSFEDDEYMELFSKIDMCDSLEEEEDGKTVFKSCKSTKDDNSIKATVELDLDALEKETKENEDEDIPFEKSMSLDELKSALEEEGLTCTIK